MSLSIQDFGLGASIGGAALSILGAYQKSKSDKKAYDYQAQVDQNNAGLAGMQARDAIQRGEINASNQRIRTAQLIGTQRAAMAANGVALDEGSPLRVLDDTAFMGEKDALTILDNSNREAWAIRNQATNYSNNANLLHARADAENPFVNAAGTALTTGGTVADKWYNYSKTINAVS